jgi:hypothetical protein
MREEELEVDMTVEGVVRRNSANSSVKEVKDSRDVEEDK